MKIVSVVGARPQFVKLGMMTRAFEAASQGAAELRHLVVHTGQHYDRNLSDVFFDELELAAPDVNLGVGSGSHGTQTAEMLRGLEEAFRTLDPDLVLAYGDTNTTLASALAAVKLQIPVAHVEAGLRSHNKRMPEEVNRIVTDHVSTILFCPSQKAVENLCKEGFASPLLGGRLVPVGSLRNETRATADFPWIANVGDVMYDSVLYHRDRARSCTSVLQDLCLVGSEYAVLTVHRAENTDDPRRLREIFSGAASVARSGLPVVCPLHPRTKSVLAQHVSPRVVEPVRIIEPISYYEMLILLANARLVLTDSGGVQREAYMLGVDCVTLRDETEWVELLETGMNRLAGANEAEITAAVAALLHRLPPIRTEPLYGDGSAASRIASICLEWCRLG